jgi:hypothetical protein
LADRNYENEYISNLKKIEKYKNLLEKIEKDISNKEATYEDIEYYLYKEYLQYNDFDTDNYIIYLDKTIPIKMK